MLVIGKTIGGGIPVGAYGFTNEAVAADHARARARDSDVGGIGGTLAGYALSLAATRATLGEVLTDAAFARMIPLAERWEAGVNEVLRARRRPVARDPARAHAPSTTSCRRRPGPARSNGPTATPSSSASSTCGR